MTADNNNQRLFEPCCSRKILTLPCTDIDLLYRRSQLEA